jgi:hypothetical protein
LAPLPLRLPPGVDLKAELLRHVAERGWSAAMVDAATGFDELVIRRDSRPTDRD